MNNLYVKLAKINISNNKPLYLPYILSGVMTVAMFYLMVFLNNNKGLNKIPGGESLKIILYMGVAVIGIFSYIFIFYTNSFIIKRRKREIGVYNILGMEKRHIAKVLGMETLFVALVAIIGGLAAGIIFSKLMLMLLYRILQYEESILFSVTISGIELTALVFGVLYFLVLLYNLMQIRLANPIELLHGGNVGEREPKTKGAQAVFGVVCIAVSYYIALTTVNPLKVLGEFFIAVILVIAGTYSLFSAGSITLLKALRRNKKFYYQPKHFTAVSGMLYRMKQNAAGLASICILSTMVLVMVSTTVSMYTGVEDELKARYPMEIMFYNEGRSSHAVADDLEQQIQDMIEGQGRTIKDMRHYGYVAMSAVRDGESFTPVTKKTFNGQMSLVNLITRENLLEMDDSFTEQSVPKVLKGQVNIYASNQYTGEQITLMGHTYPVADAKVYTADADSYMANMLEGDYYVVLDSQETLDELYAEAAKTMDLLYSDTIGVNIDGTDEQKIAISNAIRESFNLTENENIEESYVECRQANKQDFFMIYGGLFFLGIFLGSIFLMVTVMIIFYKQISEGYDDKQRYEIMEKVGMSNVEVKASIQSQVRIVFFLPLLTAAVHVLAAFPMLTRLLSILNLTNHVLFAGCLLATFVVFAMIYYVVFKVTSKSYYKIVGNQV